MILMLFIPGAANRWDAIPNPVQWLYVFAWLAVGLLSHRTFQESLATALPSPDAPRFLLRAMRIRLRTNAAAFALCALGYLYLSGFAEVAASYLERTVLGASGPTATASWATFAVACAISGVIGNFVYDILKRTLIASASKLLLDESPSTSQRPRSDA